MPHKVAAGRNQREEQKHGARHSASIMRVALAAAFALLAGAASAKSVVTLNGSSFKRKVLDDDGVWMVEFFAP